MGVGAYGAVCGSGDVSLTIRDWTDTQVSTTLPAAATAQTLDATCYVCDSAGTGTCSLANAVTANNGVFSYDSTAAAVFTFNQNVAFT